jgi:hypothetical protein
LSAALDSLARDLVAGRKRHKTYRQFKMYNDPTLNPHLYAPATPTPPAAESTASTRSAAADSFRRAG